jgi:regulator of sigma E protease
MRRTIQVERAGERLDIEIPREYIPEVLKGRGLISYRIPFEDMKVIAFVKGSPAEEAGLLKNDVIAGIDGLIFEYHDEFQNYLVGNAGKPVTLNLIRERNNKNLTVPVNEMGLLGIQFEAKPLSHIFDLKTTTYGFFESIPAGITKGVKTISNYLKQFRVLFSKGTEGHKALGGFVTIANLFPAKWDWQIFWERTAFLSIILAVMNILPIPALDGGHIMFLMYEVVTGRKPSDKFLENAQIVGMIILFSLLILANGNDILRWINK